LCKIDKIGRSYRLMCFWESSMLGKDILLVVTATAKKPWVFTEEDNTSTDFTGVRPTLEINEP
ncbi:hypothetical protein LJC49_08980, partial [Ruminococcaceae bacterium OttesenSCG-928-I18]|nr:hypothetical protein [Ruminococcaceae bacterium OttesenSCG-928-I18]